MRLASGRVAPHATPGLTVTLALGGRTRVGWSGGGLSVDRALRRGDLLVVPSGLVHEAELRDAADLLAVTVSDPFAAALAADLGVDLAGFSPRVGVRDRHAEAALRALFAERAHTGSPARRIAEAAATTALVRLLAPEAAGAAEGGVSETALSAARVRRVADHVLAHLGSEITVAGLAAVADLSPAHFSRLFAAATGEPPGRYVQSVRLDEAARQLRRGQASVADVAARVGYGDPSAFGAAFRQRFGTSPTAYRKAHDR